MTSNLVPTEGADIKATLEALGRNFSFDAQVIDGLVKSRIQNLADRLVQGHRARLRRQQRRSSTSRLPTINLRSTTGCEDLVVEAL